VCDFGMSVYIRLHRRYSHRMPSVPTWRTPSKASGGHKNANWALELHRPSWNDPRIPKCTAIAKSTGQKCKRPAVRGSCKCVTHSGRRNLEERLLDGSSLRKHNTRPPVKGPTKIVGERSRLADHVLAWKSHGNVYERLKAIDGEYAQIENKAVRNYLLSLSISAKLSHYKTFANRKIDPRAWYELLKHIKNKDL